MITSDAELLVVQRQLDRVTRSLESLRAMVEPVNPANFEVLSESYRELQQSLQQNIDDYFRRKAENEPSCNPEPTPELTTADY